MHNCLHIIDTHHCLHIIDMHPCAIPVSNEKHRQGRSMSRVEHSLLRAAVMTREGVGSGCLASILLITPFLNSLASLCCAAVQAFSEECICKEQGPIPLSCKDLL